MGLKALEIVDEEFYALCKDFPYLMARISYRKIDSTTVWDLIGRIKKRISNECIELPMPTCKSCGVDHDPYLLCEDIEPDTDALKDDEEGYCPQTRREQEHEPPF